MGAAEARALWQRRASNRCLVCHQYHSSSSPSSSSSSRNTEKASFYSSSGDFSDDNTKWWLKGSTNNGGFDEKEIITNFFFEDTTKGKKLQQFVDMTKEEQEEEGEEDYNGFISKKVESTTPWWKAMTDKDELAFLVATKSLDVNIQNCDLPPPQKLRCTNSGGKGFKAAEVKSSPWKQGVWKSENRFESKNMSPVSSPSRSVELSKGELLEALRHSQTRAREAEEAVREACAEKERMIAILLRQASQILAYKHWLKLLEMEALYLKEEEEEEEGEEIKGVNLKKRKQRKKKKKKKKMNGGIGRYLMACALGFSLIGAGLFLGWTVGWLFTL